MAAPPRKKWTREDYLRDAQEYLASLPPEHFMESVPQNRQAQITEASFQLISRRRPGFHGFGELLIHGRKGDEFLRVCPDNMVVLGDINGDEDRLSYALEHEPAPVFWTLEYVSESNQRKDYVENFQKYEQDVKVPYYLIFHPAEQDLQLYRLRGGKYAPVQSNESGRLELHEVEVEVALLNGWVRYWHRGELIAIPVELDQQVRDRDEQIRRQDDQLRQRDDEIHQRDDQLRQRDDEIHKRDDQLKQRDDQLDAVLAALRPVVEARARLAGRQDVLDRLGETADAGQLARWLAELG